MLKVTWSLQGDLEQLRVPAWTGLERGERLWEHTCFEVFVSRAGDAAYHELNFAPSGMWAAYAFERHRKRTPSADAPLDPQVVVRRAETTLELEAWIRLERLSAEYVHAPLALGLSAVIEDCRGGLSYWALAHPAEKPDFHHPDSFTLKMDPGSSPG